MKKNAVAMRGIASWCAKHISAAQRRAFREAGGNSGYIKEMPRARVLELFPGIKGIPKGTQALFVVSDSKGMPRIVADTYSAAYGALKSENLEFVGLH